MAKYNKHFKDLFENAQYFSMHEWTFHRDNINKMMMDIETLKDSKIVEVNRGIDWKQYIAIYMAGIEKFILTEKSKSIDARRQRLSVYVQKYFHIEKENSIVATTYFKYIVELNVLTI